MGVNEQRLVVSENPTAEHVLRNRDAWDTWAEKYVEPGKRHWAAEPRWGIWGIPEADVHVLPDVAGRDTIELGCGTGYVSAWLARRGARPVGIDNSEAQLRTARTLQQEHGITFPLIHGDAERVPLPDQSFDLAISEYGASIWADPYAWIPEAARLLPPGGDLIFLVNGTILMLCMQDLETDAATAQLRRPYFDMHRFEWPDGIGEVEFHLGYGEMIRLLVQSGFEVLDLIELRPPADATSRYTFVTADWARDWPSEEIWVARKK